MRMALQLNRHKCTNTPTHCITAVRANVVSTLGAVPILLARLVQTLAAAEITKTTFVVAFGQFGGRDALHGVPLGAVACRCCLLHLEQFGKLRCAMLLGCFLI